MKKGNKGFTLIELLVVIAIIAILSTVVMAGLNQARSKSRDARRLSDMKQMQTALNLYYDSCGGYPSFESDVPIASPGNDADQLGQETSLGCSGSTTLGTFIGTMPTNPSPGGKDYTYCSATIADPATCADSTESYLIKFNIENASGGISSGDHIATPRGIE